MTVSPGHLPVATGPQRPDLLLIDDHPLLAHALAHQLSADDRVIEIAQPFDDRDRLLSAVIDRRPGLVVLDLGLPVEGGGCGLVGPLVDAGLRVAVLTGETDRLLWARCSAAGAQVVLSKAEDLDRLTSTIERLLSDEPVRPHQRSELDALLQRAEAERRRDLDGFDRLTARERQVVSGLLAGQSLRWMAEDREVSIETIRTQAKSVMRKLGVTSQLEVVARATAAGWTGG